MELKTTRMTNNSLLDSKKTYDVKGIVVTGTYAYSSDSSYYQNDRIDYAGTTETGDQVEFGFCTDTGKLTKFRYPLYKETDLTRPIHTEAECETIAKEFLQGLVDPSATYEIEETVYRDNESYGGGSYEFVFMRMIDNIKTDETIHVRVTVRGRVVYYLANMLDSMNLQSKLTYDEEGVTKAIQEKMADIYRPMADTHSYSYIIVDARFTRLEDGHIHLRYEIEADIYRTDIKDDLGFVDYTELLIRID